MTKHRTPTPIQFARSGQGSLRLIHADHPHPIWVSCLTRANGRSTWHVTFSQPADAPALSPTSRVPFARAAQLIRESHVTLVAAPEQDEQEAVREARKGGPEAPGRLMEPWDTEHPEGDGPADAEAQAEFDAFMDDEREEQDEHEWDADDAIDLNEECANCLRLAGAHRASDGHCPSVYLHDAVIAWHRTQRFRSSTWDDDTHADEPVFAPEDDAREIDDLRAHPVWESPVRNAEAAFVTWAAIGTRGLTDTVFGLMRDAFIAGYIAAVAAGKREGGR